MGASRARQRTPPLTPTVTSFHLGTPPQLCFAANLVILVWFGCGEKKALFGRQGMGLSLEGVNELVGLGAVDTPVPSRAAATANEWENGEMPNLQRGLGLTFRWECFAAYSPHYCHRIRCDLNTAWATTLTSLGRHCNVQNETFEEEKAPDFSGLKIATSIKAPEAITEPQEEEVETGEWCCLQPTLNITAACP
jgi:hypothetical protein